jgi:hypothetical protein
MKAQAGYYSLDSAKSVLEMRIATLAEVIPEGSRLLDIGCNDGSVSKGLLARGTASHVHGFDLDNLIENPVEGLDFTKLDLMNCELGDLPDAGGVLLLNIMHHINGASEDRAKHVMNYLLDRYPFVCIDMGSRTEVGDWGWLQEFTSRYSSDQEMWNILFENAGWRFKLLRYPAQGGDRTLWKLYRSEYAVGELKVLSTWRRTEGSDPLDKALIAADSDDTEGYPYVQFEIVESPQRDKFFVKRYIGDSHYKLAELEFHIYQLALNAIERTKDRGVLEINCLRLPVCLGSRPDNSIVFQFEPDLFCSKPLHFQDWSIALDAEQVRAASILACSFIEIPPIPRTQLLFMADFQAANGWDGLTVLDFEPNTWVLDSLETASNNPIIGDTETLDVGPTSSAWIVGKRIFYPARLNGAVITAGLSAAAVDQLFGQSYGKLNELDHGPAVDAIKRKFARDRVQPDGWIMVSEDDLSRV